MFVGGEAEKLSPLPHFQSPSPHPSQIDVYPEGVLPGGFSLPRHTPHTLKGQAWAVGSATAGAPKKGQLRRGILVG